MGGLLNPSQRTALWSDKLLNQTASWYEWIQILALTNSDYPADPNHPFIDTPKNANDPSALHQYIADRAGTAMVRKEYWRHVTAFFEQTLVTNLVIAVAGKNGQFTQGEWKMEWSRAGASTQPYERFVPGGNPAGGVLPARKASPARSR